jgi:hypothetical protein
MQDEFWRAAAVARDEGDLRGRDGSHARPGPTQSFVHPRACAHRRLYWTPLCSSRRICECRLGASRRGPNIALLRRRYFQESQVGKMRLRQPATITVDTFPGLKLKGHVDSLAPATDVVFAPIQPDND